MEELRINKNVLSLKESATLAINLEAINRRKNGETIYHWGFGQSPFPVPEKIQQELARRTQHKEYLPTNGLQTLRETLRDFYKNNKSLTFNQENIFIGPGSKELIFQMLYLLDGEFIIPAPSWVSYGPQVDLKGERAKVFITKKEDDYKIIPAHFEQFLLSLNEGQKILILNSPSNPTGQVYTQNELNDLSKVLRKHNIIVISDEIYSEVNFTDSQTPSLASFYPERTIITGGLSKAQSAGGYRLGYMLIPNEMSSVIKPLKSIISETFSAVSAPIQYASIKAWEGDKETETEVMLATSIHNKVANYFYDRLIAMKIETPRPQGAFYLFIDFSNYRESLERLNINSGVSLCSYLLDNLGIALLPGSDFYFPEESLTARLAFVDYDGTIAMDKLNASSDIEEILLLFPQIKQGLDRLENFLNRL